MPASKALQLCGGQLVLAVLPHHLQHPVTSGAVVLPTLQNRLVQQAVECVQHLGGGKAVSGAHRFSGAQVETAREHRGPGPQQPFLLGAQFMAPAEQRPQRAVPSRTDTPGRGEQREPLIEPVGQLTHRQRSQPDGRKLDGQRHALHRLAHTAHIVGVVRRDGEPGHHRGPALHEQPHRVGVAKISPVGGYTERRHRQHPFTFDSERLPAGGQQHQLRAADDQRVRQSRARGQKVLAVVQDQQHPAAPQLLDQQVDWRTRGLVTQAQAGGDRADQQLGIGQLGQADERRAIDEGAPHEVCDVCGQPGLADTTRAGQRDQAGRAQQPPDLLRFRLAADVGTWLPRKRARRTRRLIIGPRGKRLRRLHGPSVTAGQRPRRALTTT